MRKQSGMSSCVVAAALLGTGACADGSGGGSGDVQVFVAAEDTIPEGLTPGTGEEQIQDGWSVAYSKFIVVFGNFHASRSAEPDAHLEDNEASVLDMLQLPEGGLVIHELAGVAAERWDKVGFSLPNATSSATCTEGVSSADCQRMKDDGLSLWVAGTISKTEGATTTELGFEWPLAVGTSFDDCAPDEGDAGFAVPSGGTVQVKPTIHGDHWFFTNITMGAEITHRCAGWIAAADADEDGHVTIEELQATPASEVFPTSGSGACVYNLSGAGTIATAHDYLLAQARTLGDYQGDGECPTRTSLP